VIVLENDSWLLAGFKLCLASRQKTGFSLGREPENTFHVRRRFHTGCVGSSILASLSEAGGNGLNFAKQAPSPHLTSSFDRGLKRTHAVAYAIGKPIGLGPIVFCNSLN
jgi:hypothetical protein